LQRFRRFCNQPGALFFVVHHHGPVTSGCQGNRQRPRGRGHLQNRFDLGDQFVAEVQEPAPDERRLRDAIGRVPFLAIPICKTFQETITDARTIKIPVGAELQPFSSGSQQQAVSPQWSVRD
jgi:hypothetical protein